MITKSMSIILLLMTALLLGTIASIHAQSQPRLQPTSFDTHPHPISRRMSQLHADELEAFSVHELKGERA